MKIRSYKFLFRIFSFLSDKTNGASLFVKYKLVLGALLVSLTTVSCDRDDDKEIIMCYDMPTIENENDDTNKSNTNTDTNNKSIITEVVTNTENKT